MLHILTFSSGDGGGEILYKPKHGSCRTPGGFRSQCSEEPKSRSEACAATAAAAAVSKAAASTATTATATTPATAATATVSSVGTWTSCAKCVGLARAWKGWKRKERRSKGEQGETAEREVECRPGLLLDLSLCTHVSSSPNPCPTSHYKMTDSNLKCPWMPNYLLPTIAHSVDLYFRFNIRY